MRLINSRLNPKKYNKVRDHTFTNKVYTVSNIIRRYGPNLFLVDYVVKSKCDRFTQFNSWNRFNTTWFLSRKKGGREGWTDRLWEVDLSWSTISRSCHKSENLIEKSQKMNEKLTLLWYVVKEERSELNIVNLLTIWCRVMELVASSTRNWVGANSKSNFWCI